MWAFRRKCAWVAIVAAYAFVLHSFIGSATTTGILGGVAADSFAICSAIASPSDQGGPAQPSNRPNAHYTCCVLCAAALASEPARLSLPIALSISVRSALIPIRLTIATGQLPKLSQGPPQPV